MDCCSHGHVLTCRRWIWSTLTSVAAMVGGGVEPRGSTAAAQTAETVAAALAVLRESISVRCSQVDRFYSIPSTIRKSRTAPSPSAFNASAYAALS
jgi:hypothetical protein